MKRCLIICAVMAVSLSAFAVEGYRATVCLANGNTIQTEFFGTKDKIEDYVVRGYLDGQRVEYKLSELSEVILSEYETKYYDNGGYNQSAKKGDLIVVAASGKRFALTNCDLNNGEVEYCYLDPVTESRRFSITHICKGIVSIKIGESVGQMKKNPQTGEFFPAIYSFDPFTGQKLEWANP